MEVSVCLDRLEDSSYADLLLLAGAIESSGYLDDEDAALLALVRKELERRGSAVKYLN